VRTVYEGVTINPDQMGGLTCTRGMRMPVTTVIGQLAAGLTHDEILADFSISRKPTSTRRSSTRRPRCCRVGAHHLPAAEAVRRPERCGAGSRGATSVCVRPWSRATTADELCAAHPCRLRAGHERGGSGRGRRARAQIPERARHERAMTGSRSPERSG